MFLLFCFQVLLFFTVSIQVISLQTMKQHRTQNLDIVKDVKFSSYSGNPYILACNSSSQCQDTVLDECVIDFPEQNTWYCNCFCDGNGPCKTNRDCCNNNCINEVCTHNGGEQGTVCSGACSTCATNYECQLLPGDVGVGFCDYSDVKTTNSIPATTKNVRSSSSTATKDTTTQSMTSTTTKPLATCTQTPGNPWIYLGCRNGKSDCQGTIKDSCIELDPSNPNTWVCENYCKGGSCKINEDCVNNECINGICSSSGGSEGTLCIPTNPSCANCTQGLTCYPVYGIDGYCGYC